MSTETQLTTAEQLLRMPRGTVRRELVEGELRAMSPAGHRHGWIVMRISAPLATYVHERDLGRVYTAETGFLLSRNPDTVRAPDVAFVARERVAAAGKVQGFFPGAPDLAIEVTSPSDSYNDLELKADQWLAAGCRAVVVVIPANATLSIRRSRTEIEILTAEDTFQLEDIVPGFRLPVAEIFAE